MPCGCSRGERYSTWNPVRGESKQLERYDERNILHIKCTDPPTDGDVKELRVWAECYQDKRTTWEPGEGEYERRFGN